jgi:hypothetical protein
MRRCATARLAMQPAHHQQRPEHHENGEQGGQDHHRPLEPSPSTNRFGPNAASLSTTTPAIAAPATATTGHPESAM